MIILPQYEVAWVVQMLRKISKIIDYAFNKTFNSIDALTEEVRQMRLVVLQNRAALDFILVAKGGVCALIGDECCPYISDSSGNIEPELTEAGKAVSKLHPISMMEYLLGLVKWGNKWLCMVYFISIRNLYYSLKRSMGFIFFTYLYLPQSNAASVPGAPLH